MKLTDIPVARPIPAPVGTVFDVWMDPRSPGRRLTIFASFSLHKMLMADE
jgi:hypothetical protein